jgi:glycosyltransferase involved in cell wall biosynthesis
MSRSAKVVVVMPAYNAARTLERTYNDIPRAVVDRIILVDDVSHDETVEIAQRLGLKVIVHIQNRGYGGNQKTCYLEALREGADVVVMLHPDYQYDSRLVPDLIAPILEGRADLVLGSRFLGSGALAGGMPLSVAMTVSVFVLGPLASVVAQVSWPLVGFRKTPAGASAPSV